MGRCCSCARRAIAPTSRYGTAAQLMELIDRLHRHGFCTCT